MSGDATDNATDASQLKVPHLARQDTRPNTLMTSAHFL